MLALQEASSQLLSPAWETDDARTDTTVMDARRYSFASAVKDAMSIKRYRQKGKLP